MDRRDFLKKTAATSAVASAGVAAPAVWSPARADARSDPLHRAPRALVERQAHDATSPVCAEARVRTASRKSRARARKLG